MVLKLVIGAYIFINVYKMFSFGDDDVSQSLRKLDLDKAGSVSHNQTDGLFLFWVLRNTDGGNKPLWLNDL